MKSIALSPILLLVAEDPYQKRKFLESLRAQIKAISPNFEEEGVDYKQSKWADIFDTASTFPLLGSKRLLVVQVPKELTADDEGALSHFGKVPSPFTYLVVVLRKVDQRKKFIKECIQKNILHVLSKPTIKDLPYLIERIAKDIDLSIPAPILKELSHVWQPDLALIELELTKLKLFCHPEKKVSPESVAALVLKTSSENVFQFLDKLFEGNALKALEMSRELLAGDTVPLSLSAMIVRHLLILAKCHTYLASGGNPTQGAQFIGVPPFVASKYFQQAKKIRPSAIRSILGVLAQMDRDLKGSGVPPGHVFEQALRAIGQTLYR